MPKSRVPDAWDDDDWETQADRIIPEEVTSPGPQVPLTKAARQAEHQAANRKLWEEASETKETFHYLEATNNVPLSTNFKPQVKVLSRKPVIAKREALSGMDQLALDDGGDENNKQPTLSAEEIRAKQKRDREEKQRKYDEARAKIFGESVPSSRGSSPRMGTTTPPRVDGRGNQRGIRGRGGGQNARAISSNTSKAANTEEFEPRRQELVQAGATRELYDPNYATKTDTMPKREDGYSSPRYQHDHTPIRTPRGPDGSGRGGFGFTRRGD